MSERIEERLRKAARNYRKLGDHTAASMFIEAADTIIELRGALMVASFHYRPLSEETAKNEKLRELVQYVLDKNCGDDWFATKAGELGLVAHY